jgi:uncharacterized protein
MKSITQIPFDTDILTEFFRQQPIIKVFLFGSCVRGENTEDSDIDILVELEKGTDLFKFIKIKLQLEDLLHKQVDLLSSNGISPRLRPRIDSEKLLIYEKQDW